ncbi:MAG: hypothetical protein V4555_19130 [Acidobacteriota bacterium]
MRRVLVFLCLVLSLPLTSRADSAPHWVKVHSDHFVVITDSNEKEARHIAGQFERMRSLFHTLLPRAASDAPSPIVVLALKNAKGFKALEPTAYLAKGSLSLAGYFLQTPDQNYILMNLESEGEEHPFSTIYHEYTHFIVRKAEWIPLWLNEGLAEFYQNSTIESKDVLVGQPSGNDILYLRQNRLLPLQTLLAVDASSPYYHEEEKGSVFYAESWALTHMIEITDAQNKTHLLQDYASLLAKQEDPVSAAREAFGDLAVLQKRLDAYVSGLSFQQFKVNLTVTADEASFKSVPVSVADADAIRADVLVWNGRQDDAKALLDGVLRDDPKNALAVESMGSLCYARHDAACAVKWYGQAIQLNSGSYVALYFYASMAMRDGSGNDDEIESSLRKAIQLAPSYAPAYDALAGFYTLRHEKLDEAYLLSVQAVQLEPEVIAYRLNSANVLLQRKQPENAVRALQTALTIARKPEEIAELHQRIAQLTNYQQAMERYAAVKAKEDAAGPTDNGSAANSTVMTVDDSDEVPKQRTFAAPAAGAVRRTARGVIHHVQCTYPAVITIDVQSAGKTLSLYAQNYMKVTYSTLNFVTKDSLDPCKMMDGMNAKVAYLPVTDPAVGGQIVAIELAK